MLKVTSIISSLIFLLFVGSGSYARTFTEQASTQKSSTEEKQEKSKDSSDENGEPNETAVQLDVFQAISLVNAQLRWKDYHAENYRNSRTLLSSKKLDVKELQSDESVELFDLFGNAALLPAAENQLIQVLWSSTSVVKATSQRSLKTQENTIAFILNCGTYPTDLA
ncbi:MAG: hypothetical protein NXI10_11575 [bacterium]|nr:hypothetical protein [bacterium]